MLTVVCNFQKYLIKYNAFFGRKLISPLTPLELKKLPPSIPNFVHIYNLLGHKICQFQETLCIHPEHTSSRQ